MILKRRRRRRRGPLTAEVSGLNLAVRGRPRGSTSVRLTRLGCNNTATGRAYPLTALIVNKSFENVDVCQIVCAVVPRPISQAIGPWP